MRKLSHVIGIDDAPFHRASRGDVAIVGVAFARLRLEGVLIGRVRRDGANATRAVADLVGGSRFAAHNQVVMLQGIAFGGFNVVDLAELSERLGTAVLAVARRAPDLGAIRRALLDRVPGGRRKWALIERAGPMEPVAGVYVQRAGLTLAESGQLIADLAVHGRLPEPVRVAHLIAGALARGHSQGRA